MGGCIILLVLVVLCGGALAPEHPFAGMLLVSFLIVLVGFLCKDSISTNTSNSKSFDMGNPMIPHMYRKQIRRFIKRR